jgi:hypothetical protein
MEKMMSHRIAKSCVYILVFLFALNSWAVFDYQQSREAFSRVVNQAVQDTLDEIKLALLKKENKKKSQEKEFRQFLESRAVEFVLANSGKLLEEFSRSTDLLEQIEIGESRRCPIKVLEGFKRRMHGILVRKKEFISSISAQKNDLVKDRKIKRRTFNRLVRQLEPIFSSFSTKYDNSIFAGFSKEFKGFQFIFESHLLNDRYNHIEASLVHQEVMPAAQALHSEVSYENYVEDALTFDEIEGTCSICLEQVSESAPLTKMERCTHPSSYCKTCLKNHFDVSSTEDLHSMQCPDQFCYAAPTENDFFRCFEFSEVVDLKKKLLQIRQHLPGAKKIYSICLEKDCSGLIIHSKYVTSSSEKILNCAQCGVRRCMNCGTQNPFGNNCVEHQASAESHEALKPLLESAVIQKCPQCNEGIARIAGCKNMKCTRCQTKFIYIGDYAEEKNLPSNE